ncbi:winged helix-turn-helix transcriptional regulator [Adlercreutzia faecimuris]|uniref:winged helix-turn-helix transcriptional regulator n=1 Tax=Adlercreutzia faecimuris TaxID=2897341 RepID=UPI003D300956
MRRPARHTGPLSQGGRAPRAPAWVRRPRGRENQAEEDPQVEYSLTEIGESLRPAMDALRARAR